MNDFLLLPRPWLNASPAEISRVLTPGLEGDEVCVQSGRIYVKGNLVLADGTTRTLGYWHQFVPVGVTHCIPE